MEIKEENEGRNHRKEGNKGRKQRKETKEEISAGLDGKSARERGRAGKKKGVGGGSEYVVTAGDGE